MSLEYPVTEARGINIFDSNRWQRFAARVLAEPAGSRRLERVVEGSWFYLVFTAFYLVLLIFPQFYLVLPSFT